jgi:hypothetical protein
MRALKPFISVLFAAVVASGAVASDWGHWGPWPTPKDSPFIGAGFKHDDGGTLIILCDTKTKLISLLLEEPRASWQPGTQLNFMTRVDTVPDPGASKAFVIGPTRYVVKEEATFHLMAMGQATSYFAVGMGDYARIFPAAHFRNTTDSVLRACGDHW